MYSVKKVFLPAIVLLFSISAFAGKVGWSHSDSLQTIESAFESSTDSLCFSNHSFIKSMGWNPIGKLLGWVADREGACQGMVGVAAALKQRAIFRPHKRKQSTRKLKRKIRRAVGLYENDCKKGKIYIDGYANTKELCSSKTGVLKRKSVWFNLKIAAKEILPKLDFFFKGMLDSPKKKSQKILKTLLSFQKELKKGKNPLMLVRKHVTMVTGMKVIRNEEGLINKVIVHHYDPNDIISSARNLRKKTYTFDHNNQLIRGRLIWDVTPDPLTRFKCLFIKKDKKTKLY